MIEVIKVLTPILGLLFPIIIALINKKEKVDKFYNLDKDLNISFLNYLKIAREIDNYLAITQEVNPEYLQSIDIPSRELFYIINKICTLKLDKMFTKNQFTSFKPWIKDVVEMKIINTHFKIFGEEEDAKKYYKNIFTVYEKYCKKG